EAPAATERARRAAKSGFRTSHSSRGQLTTRVSLSDTSSSFTCVSDSSFRTESLVRTNQVRPWWRKNSRDRIPGLLFRDISHSDGPARPSTLQSSTLSRTWTEEPHWVQVLT